MQLGLATLYLNDLALNTDQINEQVHLRLKYGFSFIIFYGKQFNFLLDLHNLLYQFLSGWTELFGYDFTEN